MPNKKTIGKDAIQKDETNYLIELVEKFKKSKNKKITDEIFEEIIKILNPKIQKIVLKFRIPGFTNDDIFQCSLEALHTKAIRDYDITKGSEIGKPADFSRFALLCIRRHLSTILKNQFMNKKAALSTSVSLDSVQKNDTNKNGEEVTLINILAGTEIDLLSSTGNSEEFKLLVNGLLKELSSFEKKVFFLYAKDYSYSEIAAILYKKKKATSSQRKSIDNSLVRLKTKAKEILKMFEKENPDKNSENYL